MNQKRTRTKRRTQSPGFTLVEILIVIVIIGILAGLATPKFMHAATKAKQVEAKEMLNQLYALERSYRIENDQYWIPPAGITATKNTPNAFAELGFELVPQARYVYSIEGDQDHFVAHALATDLDDDPTLDEWTIDQSGELKAVSNDATQ